MTTRHLGKQLEKRLKAASCVPFGRPFQIEVSDVGAAAGRRDGRVGGGEHGGERGGGGGHGQEQLRRRRQPPLHAAVAGGRLASGKLTIQSLMGKLASS